MAGIAATQTAVGQRSSVSEQSVAAQPRPPATGLDGPTPGPVQVAAPPGYRRTGEKLAWAVVGGLSAIAAVYVMLASPEQTRLAEAEQTASLPDTGRSRDLLPDKNTGSSDPLPIATAPATDTERGSSAAPMINPKDTFAATGSSDQGPSEAQWVVRPATTLSDCEQALGRPFRLKQKQRSHMASAPYKHARKALLRGNNDTAIRSLCLAAEWHVAGPATYALAQLYLKLGDYEKAEQWLKRVPETPKRRRLQAQELLGDLLAQRAFDRQTLTYLQQFHPQAVTPQARDRVATRYASSGKSALAKKDYWYAERLFRRALVLTHDQPLATTGLSQALLHQGFDRPAFSWAKQGQSLAPNTWDAEYALADAALKNGDADLAEEALVRLRALAPKDRRLKALRSRLKLL